MRTASPVGLADLADALLHLKPEEKALVEIARVLGIAAVSAPQEEIEPPLPPVPDKPAKEPKPSKPEPPTEPLTSIDLNVETVQGPTRDETLPEVVRRANVLPISQEMLHPVPTPLLRLQQIRTFLQDHVGHSVPSETIDVDVTVEQLARLRLRTLPRKHRRGFRRGVIAVFDTSPGMEPFRDDVAQMHDAVQRFVGPHLMGTIDVTRWPFDADLSQRTRPGATAFLVTDLGLGRLRGTRRLWQEDWLAFSNRLLRAGQRVVAVVPYGPRRWPNRWAMEITHWHESTAQTAADSVTQVEDLARALSICGRIDAALVRAARRTLFPTSDAGLEADFLFSPLLTISTSRTVVFHDDELPRLRQEIAKRPSELESARRFLVEYRKAVGPESVAVEEDVVYFALRQSDGDQKEIEARIATILRTILARNDDVDLVRWSSGVVHELPEWARQIDLIESLEQASSVRLGRPPLRRVKSWLLPRETATVGIAADGDELILREPPEGGDATFTVPATMPRVVSVFALGQAEPTYAQFRAGQPGRIPRRPSIEIETLDGTRIRVTAARSRAVAPGIELIRYFDDYISGMNAIAFHPRGHLLATDMRLWQTDTGREIANFDDDPERLIVSVAFDRSGRFLASGDKNGTIQIRDADTGKTTNVVRTRTKAAVLSLAFDDEGRLANGNTDGTMTIWSRRGDQLRTLKVHKSPIRKIAFDPSGRIFASGSDEAVKLTDARSGNVIREFSDTGALAISPDGRLLATGDRGPSIRIWDTQTGRALWTLEGHVKRVEALAFSPDERVLVSIAFGGEFRIWDRSDWQCIAVVDRPSPQNPIPAMAFHPSRPELATAVVEPIGHTRVALWKLDYEAMRGVASPRRTAYAAAKVVLLGDTAIGKSGLAMALAGEQWQPTESTHSMQIRTIDSHEIVEGNRSIVRETLLWDLGGKPAYRLLHPLHLDDVSVALFVFDTRSKIDPFAQLQYWDRALRRANPDSSLKKFLVFARVDIGGPRLSRARIDAVVTDLGCDGYFVTSAKEGSGIAELRNAIREAIPWGRMPVVAADDLFPTVRSLVTDVRERGRPLAREGMFVDVLRANPAMTGDPNLGERVAGSLAKLEALGLVRRLTFGNLILVEPELLDNYAAELIGAAADDPDGFGTISEKTALEGGYLTRTAVRVPDRDGEGLFLRAVVEELVDRDLAMLENTRDGRLLVFPSQVRRELAEPPDRREVALAVRFRGPAASIYATLVVQLAHEDAFRRHELWRNVATFRDTAGALCGIALSEITDDGATLQIFFDKSATAETRRLFQQYVLSHVRGRALEGSVVVTQIEDATEEFIRLASAALQAPDFTRWARLRNQRRSLAFVVTESLAPDANATAALIDRFGGRAVASADKWSLILFRKIEDAVEFAKTITGEEARVAVHIGSLGEDLSAVMNFTASLLTPSTVGMTLSDQAKSELDAARSGTFDRTVTVRMKAPQAVTTLRSTKDHRPRVLVLDDEQMWLDTIEQILGNDFQLTLTTSVNEAWRHARKASFDLVILDIKLLEGASGLDVLDRLRKVIPDLRAIMLTEYPDYGAALESGRRGALDYVSRSDVADLAQTAINVLSREIPPRVFLSYERTDRPRVLRLYERLTSHGFLPWMDQKNIVSGKRWLPAIREAINDVDFFVFCASQNSVLKEGIIHQELSWALERQAQMRDESVFIIVARLEPCDVPSLLERLQFVDVYEKDGFTRLLAALGGKSARKK